MARIDWNKLVPPGTDLARERGVMMICQAAAAIYAMGRFSVSYTGARAALYQHIGDRKALIKGAIIAPFGEVVQGSLLLFLPALAALLALVLTHYLSYRRGSKSIYLMKRLPDKNLIHRQCWAMPLLGAALLAVTAALLMGVFYLIYWYATPAVCLPEVMGR